MLKIKTFGSRKPSLDIIPVFFNSKINNEWQIISVTKGKTHDVCGPGSGIYEEISPDSGTPVMCPFVEIIPGPGYRHHKKNERFLALVPFLCLLPGSTTMGPTSCAGLITA